MHEIVSSHLPILPSVREGWKCGGAPCWLEHHAILQQTHFIVKLVSIRNPIRARNDGFSENNNGANWCAAAADGFPSYAFLSILMGVNAMCTLAKQFHVPLHDERGIKMQRYLGPNAKWLFCRSGDKQRKARPALSLQEQRVCVTLVRLSAKRRMILHMYDHDVCNKYYHIERFS